MYRIAELRGTMDEFVTELEMIRRELMSICYVVFNPPSHQTRSPSQVVPTLTAFLCAVALTTTPLCGAL